MSVDLPKWERSRFQPGGGEAFVFFEEGQEIRMAALPPGLICHHAGSLDDPDFNNMHVKIRWPRAGSPP